jgi:hypothetical protein
LIIVFGHGEFLHVLQLLLDELLVGFPQDLVLFLQILYGGDEILRAIAANLLLPLSIGAVEVMAFVLALPAANLAGRVALGLDVLAGEALLHGGDALDALGRTALLAEEVGLAGTAVLRRLDDQHERLR